MSVVSQQERQRFSASKLRTRGRLGANALWDHLTRPIARSVGDVPWRADAISPEWLTPILCKDVPGAAVEAVEVFGGSSGSSVRRAIRVTYNEAGRDVGLTRHFFAKATPTVLTRMLSGWQAGQEANFFRQIRPSLAIEAPVHVFSDYDLESGRSFHLWEDLTSTRGARFCNYTYALDRRQAEQVVQTLATLHGTFYGSPRMEADLNWIPPYENFHRAANLSGARLGHDRAMIVAEHLIPSDVMERRDEIWPAAERAITVHSEEPRTLIHSDVHLGNWYITEDGRMGLCDWQCIATGSWARDFAYAISTILDIDDRRAWERDLLAGYLAAMREAGGPPIDIDHAWTLYRRQLFAALLMWTPTLVHGPGMPDMQPEKMSFEMIRRISAAISDLKALEA